MSRAVPVLVLAGALGAGKTTVLNHLLAHSGDTRIGVIVNDFGAVDIDGLLVSGRADMLFSASGGCICCATDEGMVGEMIQRLTAPAAGIDVVVVEASGVAEPAVLLHRVMTSLDRRSRFGGLVLVVDGEQPADDLERQLPLADLIAITKPDRAGEKALRALRARIGAVAADRPTVVAPHGALDPSLLFEPRHEPGRQLSLADLVADRHAHLQAPYRSISWERTGALHPRRLADLLAGEVPRAFRIKGIVTVEAEGARRPWTVHRVGRHVRVTPGGARRGRALGSTLVLIGPDLDGAAYDRLDACLLTEGEAPDADDLVALERFVPQALRPREPR